MVWALVSWVVALAFIIITLKNILVRAVETRRCSMAVTGTVMSVQKKVSRVGGDDAVESTLTEYIPIVSYAVSGVDYSEPFTKAYREDAYSVGQTVQVMVNPAKPSEINKKGKSNAVDLVMLVIGVLIGVVGVVLAIVS